MLEIDVILISILLSLVINFLLTKTNFCLDKKFYIHKSFATEKLTPISGGMIFLLLFLYFLPNENILFKIFIIPLFLIGFLSDINYLTSPLKRILLQIVIIFILIFLSKNLISSVRIPFFDNLLENIYFNYFFTIFCLLVLINGSNFIDGMNTLFLGYYLMITIILIFLAKEFQILNDYHELELLFLILSILFIFNFFGQLFSGDGGAYIISFIIGFLIIQIANVSERISPYFIAVLLWYPAYECLFSILRKKMSDKFTTKADNKHLHHLIFLFFREKTKLKTQYANLLSGLSINFFNFVIFYNAYNNFSQTKNLILLIFICLIFYTIIYFFLLKRLPN